MTQFSYDTSHLEGIRDLVQMLDENGKPTFLWVMKWSQYGVDPVQAAWDRESSPDAMIKLLRMSSTSSFYMALLRDEAPVWLIVHSIPPCYTHDLSMILGEGKYIRKAVPVPPRLKELIRENNEVSGKHSQTYALQP
jgi:hypothetical protein